MSGRKTQNIDHLNQEYDEHEKVTGRRRGRQGIVEGHEREQQQLRQRAVRCLFLS